MSIAKSYTVLVIRTVQVPESITVQMFREKMYSCESPFIPVKKVIAHIPKSHADTNLFCTLET